MPSAYRGQQRVLRLIDERLSKDPPQVVAPMRLGYSMRVDLRSRTEVFAYYTGRYDSPLISAAIKLLPTSGVAFDIGANVGFWTVPLALRGESVVAFEPVPSNASRIRENLALNSIEHRAEVRELALSDEPGKVALSLREDFERGAGTGNASIVIDQSDERFSTIECPVDTLDNQVAMLGVERLDVVKMDVEGHEDYVLRGARTSLERFRPVMFVEWNRDYYDRRGVNPTTAFAEALRGLDYGVLRCDLQKWGPVEGFASPRDIDDLVLVPTEAIDRALAALH